MVTDPTLAIGSNPALAIRTNPIPAIVPPQPSPLLPHGHPPPPPQILLRTIVLIGLVNQLVTAVSIWSQTPIYSWSPPSPGTKLLGTGVAPSPGGTWGRAGFLGTQRAHGCPEGLCSPVVTSSGSTHVCAHRASCAVSTGKRVKVWMLPGALHTCVCVCTHLCTPTACPCTHVFTHSPAHTHVCTHTPTRSPRSPSHPTAASTPPSLTSAPPRQTGPPVSLSSSQAGAPHVPRMWL